MQKGIVMSRFVILCCAGIGLFFIMSNSTSTQKTNSVVMNTVYIPTKDSDHSGNESIYNDARLVVSKEPDGKKVATCIGCHFKCNSCKDE
jgi:hypothetical protein